MEAIAADVTEARTTATVTMVTTIGRSERQVGVTDRVPEGATEEAPDMPPTALLEIAVVVTTFLILTWLKIVVHVCFTRNARLSRFNHSRSCWQHQMESGATSEGTTTCLCISSNRLPWYISNLAVDVAIFPLLGFFGFYGLYETDVLVLPLCGGEAPIVARYFICVVMGSLLLRPLLALCGPGETCRFKMSLLYSTFGIAMYLSVLLTGENSVLAFVGMIYQLPILCQTVRQVVVKSEAPHCAVRTANVARLTAVTSCSIVIPVIYVPYALWRQDISEMTYYSVAVFAFSVAFFGVAAVVTFIQALVQACTDLTGDTEETVGLLSHTGPSHLTANKNLMGPPDLTGKPKVPFTAYTFTFPKVETA